MELKNKKGGLASIFIIFAVIFALAIAAIFFSKIFLAVVDELQTVEQFSNNTQETLNLVEAQTIPLLDYFIFFSMIAFIIGMIIAAIYIDAPPAIIIAFIVGGIIVIFLAGQFANIFAEVTDKSAISGTASQFTLTNLIFGTALPIIALFVVAVVIVILYGKSRNVSEV